MTSRCEVATLLLACGAIAGVLATPVAVHSADWSLLPQRCHDVQLSQSGGVISIQTSGYDPYLVGELTGPRDASEQVLELEYFCAAGVDDVSVFPGPPFVAENQIELPPLAIAEGWQHYAVDLQTAAGQTIPDTATLLRIDLGSQVGVKLQIRNVHLRQPTEQERIAQRDRERRRKEKMESAEQIRRYLSDSFPLACDSVRVGSDQITLTGELQDAATDVSRWQLREYPPQYALHSDGLRVEAEFRRVDNRFQVVVPRRIEGRDRLLSGWRIHQDHFLTARQFATAIESGDAGSSEQSVRPRSQKGLSGISRRGPLEEIPQLGVTAVTLNLVLSDFISTEGGSGKQRIDAEGPPVFFNTETFRRYDPLLRFAREHDIVISAIVLIPRPRRADHASPLVHPETDGGVYAMPDLSSPRGVAVYSHVLDRIAERYRGASDSPGQISNWIAHNEVDFHPVWTNMGPQPRDLYLETYYRSMRIIHNAARAHHPQARVFVSLTHHWNVPDDGKWKQLAPREVLETLQRYTRMEGEFAWGVAYHPYPQSLFATVPWQDTEVSDDFDTPLITMQNLEVLIRFLEQPSMRGGDGAARPILLSEQGFHSDSYEPQAQRQQAAALWWAMNKVRSLPAIESFHYHRWIDHPNEGGLLLGLRTLPSAELPYGEKKLSWQLYQAIGTEREAEIAADLPQP